MLKNVEQLEMLAGGCVAVAALLGLAQAAVQFIAIPAVIAIYVQLLAIRSAITIGPTRAPLEKERP